MHYPELLSVLSAKPIFAQSKNAMDKLERQLYSSKEYIQAQYQRMIPIFVFYAFGLSRFMLGLMRGKPVGLLGLFLFVVFISLVFYTVYTSDSITKSLIPSFYEKKTESTFATKRTSLDWEWTYFLYGYTLFHPDFYGVHSYTNKYGHVAGATCGTCGGGSGCGGGGGCGGGCGRCGGCGG